MQAVGSTASSCERLVGSCLGTCLHTHTHQKMEATLSATHTLAQVGCVVLTIDNQEPVKVPVVVNEQLHHLTRAAELWRAIAE